MGIAGLLTATTGMIASLTDVGLSTSAVKNVAAAHTSEQAEELNRISTVFKRLVWITGLMGALLTLVLAPYLSQITFGDKAYTWAFRVLSITLVVNRISAGHGVMLRGMRKIKHLASSSIIGGSVGLLTTIPLYYLYGLQGIVPAIVIAGFTGLVINWYYASKLHLKKVAIPWKDTFLEGKQMLYLGFVISLSGMITLACSYIVRIFISHYGSVDEVGLYNAGFAIINTYVGMIFMAMSTDYYPRLSAVAHEPDQANQAINQQAEIALLIIAPILLVFMVFIKWVIFLLYSSAFLPIQDMILYAGMGMLFKTLSWAIAFVFLARSAGKLFFWNELITNVYMLLLNLGGYYYFGLTGLGVSFLITYVLYGAQVYFVAHYLFKYRMAPELGQIFLILAILSAACLGVILFMEELYAYIIGSSLILISAAYSFFHLNRRMDILAYFKRN